MSAIIKKVWVLKVMLLLSSSQAFSQGVVFNYYSTGTGKNITLNYSISYPNSDIGFGLGWTINSLKHPDNQANIYYKRQYATRFIDHLHLNFYYHRHVLRNLENLNPFLFYDFQGTHSAAMNDFAPSSVDGKIFHGPYFWLDNTIGAGFNVKIFGDCYLQQKAGVGAHFIIPSSVELPDVEKIITLQNATWEFIGLLNVGILFIIK
jgi:hypothetical protein